MSLFASKGLFRRKTPVILQMEVTECGAACLAMILGAHGHPITLEEARIACATARDGVDAARLVMAARSYGLETVGLRREPEQLVELSLPLVIHWNFDHFVVLEKVTRGRFVILDPACGRRTLDRTEFGRSFTGVVLTFEPGETFVRTKMLRSTFGLLLDEARHSPDAMALSAVLGVLAIVPALVMTAAIGVFTDHVIGQSRTEWNLYVLAALAGAGLFQFVLAGVSAWIVAALRIKIATHVAVGGFWRALFLPGSFFAQRSAGEIVSRLRLGSEVGGIVAGPVSRLLPDAMTALGYLAILTLYAPVLGAAVGVVTLLNLLSMALLSQRVAAANALSQVAEGAAAGTLAAGFASLDTYRLHGRERVLIERLAAAEDVALDREQRISALRAVGSAAPVVSGLLMTIVVLGVGAVLVMQGTLTLGGYIACQMIAGLLNAPIIAIAMSVPLMQEAAGAFARIDDLRRYPIASAFEEGRAIATPARITGHLKLERVSYGFALGQPLLKDITLEFQPGRLVAIMGPSGSGKSTLARLAAGLITPDSGQVRLDDVPLELWPQTMLRRVLQYVPQQSAVFSGSIDDNLKLWDSGIAQTDIARAITASGLQRVVALRSGGMQAQLTAHAPQISGGEAQRLALARALARNPAILVLDETTSALDMAAEAAVLDALRETGSTVVIVTHRPGTASRCDEIILLNAAAIVGRGPPEAILAGDDVNEGQRVKPTAPGAMKVA